MCVFAVRDPSSADDDAKAETPLKYRVFDVEGPLAATGSDWWEGLRRLAIL